MGQLSIEVEVICIVHNKEKVKLLYDILLCDYRLVRHQMNGCFVNRLCQILDIQFCICLQYKDCAKKDLT